MRWQFIFGLLIFAGATTCSREVTYQTQEILIPLDPVLSTIICSGDIETYTASQAEEECGFLIEGSTINILPFSVNLVEVGGNPAVDRAVTTSVRGPVECEATGDGCPVNCGLTNSQGIALCCQPVQGTVLSVDVTIELTEPVLSGMDQECGD